MRRLAKTEAGFGLIELLIAMTVMVIAIMAIVAAFSSGMVALNRASRASTAATLADIQMEGFRKMTYCLDRADLRPGDVGGDRLLREHHDDRARRTDATGSIRRFASTAPSERSAARSQLGDVRADRTGDGGVPAREARDDRRLRPRDDAAERAVPRDLHLRSSNRLAAADDKDEKLEMAAFTYDAINAQGLQLKGEIHAADVVSAQEQLRSRGLLAQNLVERRAKGETGARTAFKKVKAKSLQVFFRQLATMIEAGVSVVAALVTLEEQTDDKYLREVIAEIRSDVEAGMVLSQAFARHPKVFNRLYVSLIEAGESSGTLDEVLDRAATQIEKETQLKRRVRGAMVYPAVVMTFASLVLTFMLLFIIPVFVGVYDQLDGELPSLTQFVMAMSNALRHWWFIIFPAIAATIFGLRRLKRTEKGRQVWDRFKLRIPMKIGDVVRKIALARMSRTLATLVAAGVDIITRARDHGHDGRQLGDRAVARQRARARARGRPDRRAAHQPIRCSRRCSARW